MRNILVLLTIIPLFLVSGCAVDNEHIAKLPLFEAKSDTIPGLDPPYLRAKMIREKGEKGASAPENEREILAAQLMDEYQTSPDPNMRRETVDALAKIACPLRDIYLQEILKDNDVFIRLSVLEAFNKSFGGTKEELLNILIDRMKHDADKDVRIAAVRFLGKQFSSGKNEESLKERSVNELGDLLLDKIPAVRYASMQSLHIITGKDYGKDIERWMQYVKYTKGELENSPNERSFAEKIPRVDLPMFK